MLAAAAAAAVVLFVCFVVFVVFVGTAVRWRCVPQAAAVFCLLESGFEFVFVFLCGTIVIFIYLFWNSRQQQ